VFSMMDPQHRCAILIVEEQREVRDTLAAIFAVHGMSVQVASTGWEAIAIYQQQTENIDAVLIDVGMQDLDGPQTLHWLQTINAGVLCCFMTGGSTKYDDDILLAMGAKCVFRKPFHVNEVVAMLNHLVRGNISPSTARGSKTRTIASNNPDNRTMNDD
jgi:DNA-binding response OmpR family regulator